MLLCQDLPWEMADLGPSNPFPSLPASVLDMDVPARPGLREREYVGLGRGVVPRGAVYPVYDLYDRNLSEKKLPAVVLENSQLRAVFLPSLGGRLISLYSKVEGKELLFRNDQMYFGNLAICDAWFSGGIEWNVGKRGHATYTVSPVFMAKLALNGVVKEVEETGLRIFDFERESGLFWQFDFFLACDVPLLFCQARIVNPHDYAVPLYCWINTALARKKEMRVLSSVADVLYMDHEIKGLARGCMPCPFRDHGDVSYVHNNVRSANEYFFQPEEGPYWEGVAYEEGGLFFECSSRGLPYRKAFIWGDHQGGKNWQRMLSGSEPSEYLEVQAGAAPTQFHSVSLGAGEEISWVQIFGFLNADAGVLHGEWAAACSYAGQEIVRELNRSSLGELGGINQALDGEGMLGNLDNLNRILEEPARRAPEEILFSGSGWGGLEYRRLGKPESLRSFGFPSESLSDEQRPWLELLEGKRLPVGISLRTGMIERFWYLAIACSISGSGLKGKSAGRLEDRLEGELEDRLEGVDFERATAEELFHLGLTALACGEGRLGEEHLLASLDKGKSPECAWLLMKLYVSRNRYARAAQYGGILVNMPLPEWSQGIIASAGYLEVLAKGGFHERAATLFHNLPAALRDHPKITWAYAPIALKNGELEWLEGFFRQRESLMYLREGEDMIVDLWEGYEEARGSGRPLPTYLDLRVFT